ncbi:uncharacterized protein LOC111911040 [Lactuca sativa]|uniref:uncharacterized protein LOC111911040 n=1 Tax=Lactuca sativa TaxID=4236 RepID=UPI000CD9D23E|nr:uncharacterized protein LOC111911040 [Lactuca sativa]
MSGNNSSNKHTSTINIKHVVPLVLYLEQMNYDIWRELFEIHCIGYGVDDHLRPPVEPIKASSEKETLESTSAKDAWLQMDSIIKSWLYGTLSISLLNMIFKKQATALEIWESLEKVFHDNKTSKIIQIDRELRNISIRNSTITEYCNKIKSLVDRLEHMGSKVPEINLVAYMLNGLTSKYRHVVINIRHHDPPLSFWDARSILVLEEQEMIQEEKKEVSLTHMDHASSQIALNIETSNHTSNHRGGFRGGRGGRNYRGGRGGGRNGG